jgi:hypothetical protein
VAATVGTRLEASHFMPPPGTDAGAHSPILNRSIERASNLRYLIRPAPYSIVRIAERADPPRHHSYLGGQLRCV